MQIAQARPPFVEFKQVAVFDNKRSIELGYRVTKDVDRAYIMQPGSRDVFEINAEDWLKQIRQKLIDDTHDKFPQEWVDQFKRKYEQWKQGFEIPVNGTHIKEWPMLSPAQVQNFITLHIITVEDIAGMTEEAMARAGMGSRTLKEEAVKWLANRAHAQTTAKENEELKAQLAQLIERVKELETKPKPGRKPKEQLAA